MDERKPPPPPPCNLEGGCRAASADQHGQALNYGAWCGPRQRGPREPPPSRRRQAAGCPTPLSEVGPHSEVELEGGWVGGWALRAQKTACCWLPDSGGCAVQKWSAPSSSMIGPNPASSSLDCRPAARWIAATGQPSELLAAGGCPCGSGWRSDVKYYALWFKVLCSMV